MLKFGSFSAQELGPFHLPAVQKATAHGGSNEVAMILYVLEDSEHAKHPITIQMTAFVARALGVALTRAAMAADKAKGRS